MSKTLHCIRHGTALHNVNFPKMGRQAYTEFRDTPLVDYGHIESLQFGSKWKDLDKMELVVVSPLTRTIQTAQNIFVTSPNIPIIAVDYLKEHPQSEELCNNRQAVSFLKEKYPFIDFSNITENNDGMFQAKKRADNIELKYLHERIENFKKWILGRPEKIIAIVGHSSFFGEMLFNKIGDEENELIHCHPYIYDLSPTQTRTI